MADAIGVTLDEEKYRPTDRGRDAADRGADRRDRAGPRGSPAFLLAGPVDGEPVITAAVNWPWAIQASSRARGGPDAPWTWG